ncbi:MAG: FtsX-like permease family protein [Pseudomonadales bacterium]|nr:FtsX-like permease family protein [Pseudomonadales bacterium]
MFYNYLLIALQNLRKQPIFSAIKLLSLTIGMSCSVLVFLHTDFINSSNKHIDNWENTYRLVTHMKVRETNTPYRTGTTAEPYAPQLVLDYPEQIASIAKFRGANGIFSRGDEAAQNSYTFAEPDAISIFDLEFISGDAEIAIAEPNTMVISESMTEKYFADEDPQGQILTLDNATEIRVTGIFRDVPDNATFQPEIIISVETGRQIRGDNFMNNNAWISFGGTQSFLTFEDSLIAEQVNADLPNFIYRHLDENAVGFAEDIGLGLSLQRIDDIYLNPLNNFGAAENSTTKTVLYGLLTFSILILASSCINFMNLSLAQVTQRTKEIGVRKTLGANRSHIIWQFLIESTLLTTIALLLAIPLIAAVIPIYTTLTTTGFSFANLFQFEIIAALIVLTVLTGLLSGIVPAFSLSHQQAVEVIKGTGNISKVGKLTKAAVTAAQFTISSTLILLAIAVYLQTEHMRNADPAFDRENLVVLDSRFNANDPESFNYTVMRNEIAQHPGVVAVATSQIRPPGGTGINPWRLPSFPPGENITVASAVIGPEFIETLDFELLAGRGFSEEFMSDFQTSLGSDTPPEAVFGIVITDLLAERFGIASPQEALDQIFELGNLNYRVIGVIEQFYFQGGMEADENTIGIFRGRIEPMRFLTVRIDPAMTTEVLDHIDSTWNRHRPDVPINRTFVDQTFNTILEARTGGLSSAALFASIITIIIAAFGLYALASYSSLRRTKEVGVRKVLGASANSIVLLLAWDFVKPVLIACIISWPIAFYFINDFYIQFSTRADFSMLLYGFVAIGIVVLAILTVAIQCFKTANSDPVKSLRYE